MPSDSLFPSLLTFPTSSGYSHDCQVRSKIKKELPRGLAHEGSAVDVCSDFSQMEFLHVPKPSSSLRFFQQEVCPTTLPELRTSAVHSLLLRVTLVSPTNTQQSESASLPRHPHRARHCGAPMGGPQRTFYLQGPFLVSSLFVWAVQRACRILVPQLRMEPLPPAVEAWSGAHLPSRETLRTHVLYQLRG